MTERQMSRMFDRQTVLWIETRGMNRSSRRLRRANPKFDTEHVSFSVAEDTGMLYYTVNGNSFEVISAFYPIKQQLMVRVEDHVLPDLLSSYGFRVSRTDVRPAD